MSFSDEFCEVPMFRAPDDELRRLLQDSRTIAVVGLSRHEDKPSYGVPKYLQTQGYRIVPVNPRAPGELLGARVHTSLRDIPEPIDLVLIFRPAEEVPTIVEDAVAIKAKAVWMQQGIVHNASAQRAREAGLAVVMDTCAMVAHQRLLR